MAASEGKELTVLVGSSGAREPTGATTRVTRRHFPSLIATQCNGQADGPVVDMHRDTSAVSRDDESLGAEIKGATDHLLLQTLDQLMPVSVFHSFLMNSSAATEGGVSRLPLPAFKIQTTDPGGSDRSQRSRALHLAVTGGPSAR